MKTAEEWTRSAGSGYITGKLSINQWIELNAIDFNNLVKQIQKDAFEEAKRIHMSYPPSEHYECQKHLNHMAMYLEVPKGID